MPPALAWATGVRALVADEENVYYIGDGEAAAPALFRVPRGGGPPGVLARSAGGLRALVRHDGHLVSLDERGGRTVVLRLSPRGGRPTVLATAPGVEALLTAAGGLYLVRPAVGAADGIAVLRLARGSAPRPVASFGGPRYAKVAVSTAGVFFAAGAGPFVRVFFAPAGTRAPRPIWQADSTLGFPEAAVQDFIADGADVLVAYHTGSATHIARVRPDGSSTVLARGLRHAPALAIVGDRLVWTLPDGVASGPKE